LPFEDEQDEASDMMDDAGAMPVGDPLGEGTSGAALERARDEPPCLEESRSPLAE